MKVQFYWCYLPILIKERKHKPVTSIYTNWSDVCFYISFIPFYNYFLSSLMFLSKCRLLLFFFFLNPVRRFTQNWHAINDPTEYPDFSKQNSESNYKFHPRRDITNWHIPPETNYCNIKPVQHYSHHCKYGCQTDQENTIFPVAVKIEHHRQQYKTNHFQ